MGKVRVGINGFGRIGRVAFRAWWECYQDQLEIVAVNTSGSMDSGGWAHLLKYDSVYGRFEERIEILEAKRGDEIGRIKIANKEFPLLAERNPGRIRWKNYKADVVLECTGVFVDKKAEDHFKGGAKKVILSAPPKDQNIPIYLMGVNAKSYRKENLISNGSCTTNCVAPLVKLIDQEFGFEECVMITIHAYTSSQNLVDGSENDLRRARAAAQNIVPTGTGAAQAVIKAYPEAAGRFAASAIRVPVICGSYSELVFKLKKKVTIDEVNQFLTNVAADQLAGLLKVSYEPLVSCDILGNSASAIIDLPLTQVVSEDMLHLGAWYDNEWGYSCRLLEMAALIGK
ncbi:MAG: type I glyceraldehyde-3-phosphate dehydrogenase [Candidatus Shapirobacteria bacterium]